MTSALLLAVLAASAPKNPPKELDGFVRCELKANQSGSQGVSIGGKQTTSENSVLQRSEMKVKFKLRPQQSDTMLSYDGFIVAENAAIEASGSSSVGLSETHVGNTVRREEGEGGGSLNLDYEGGQYQLIPAWPVVKIVETLTSRGQKASRDTSERLDFGDIEEPLPSGGRISGSRATKQTVMPPMGLPLQGELQCTWQVDLGKGDSEPQVFVAGEKCGCDPNDEVDVTATTDGTGGKFEAFEVKTLSGKPPTVIYNKPGTGAVLLKADGRVTGEVQLIAVWRKGSKVVKSAPYSVNFCHFTQPPALKENDSWRGPSKLAWSEEGGELLIDASIKDAYVNTQPVTEVKWDISKREAGAFESKSTGLTGQLFSRQLPARNDDFGERDVFVRYEQSGCNCQSKPVKVTLFFPRDGKNNPEKKDPNWFYYWRQLDRLKGILFQYSEPLPASPECISPVSPEVKKQLLTLAGVDVGQAQASYDYCRDTIYISRRVFLIENGGQSGCVSRTGVNPAPDRGIDCFITAVLHERQHQLDYTKWWGPAMQRYDVNLDPDRDSVPTGIEKQLGCKPDVEKSCPTPPMPKPVHLLVPDNDVFTFKASWDQHQPGSVKHLDWACPGQQTQDTDCGRPEWVPP